MRYRFCIFVFLIVAFGSGCSGSGKKISLKTEKDFQNAFNEAFFNGRAKSEVRVQYGRVDLLTGEFAIEVDRLSKFHEGMGQALHYSEETGKKPALAIFIIDPGKKDLKKLDYVSDLCREYGIKVWYINKELEKSGIM